MRRFCSDSGRVNAGIDRIERNPFHRRTSRLENLITLRINAYGAFKFSSTNELSYKCSPAPRLRLLLSKTAHESQPLFLSSHILHSRREPLIGPRFHTDLPFPLGLEKVLIGFGNTSLRDQPGVVAEDSIGRVDGCPECLRIFISVAIELSLRRVVGFEHSSFLEEMTVKAGVGDDIPERFAGPPLGHHLLHELRIPGAVELRVDLGVELLEAVYERFHITGSHGGVKDDSTLGLGPLLPFRGPKDEREDTGKEENPKK